MNYSAHALALVEEGCTIGDGTQVWQYCHIRSGAVIGQSCRLAEGVFIDTGVHVGNHVKIQNRVSVYRGVEIADGVFVGPHVTFTNDMRPRAIHPDGRPIENDEWVPLATRVEYGASIGANATILPGVTLGHWCMVGAGSVVTKSVPPHAIVLGNPAKLHGVVDARGCVVHRSYEAGTFGGVEIKAEWVSPTPAE